MAIAPSKLGELVWREWSSDGALLRRLREAALVNTDVTDQEIIATFARARKEDAALPPDEREENSPEERVRVFLTPYLTAKGRLWAVPLDSLSLADE